MTLTTEATEQLDYFARRMMGSRRPSDDERFSAFIIHCHLNKAEAGAAEIRAFLETSVIANRFDAEELMDRYSSLYDAGRDLLARYDAQRSAATA
jgi:hypothetical protein